MRKHAAWVFATLLTVFSFAGLPAAEPANHDASPSEKGSGARLVVEQEVVDAGPVVRGELAKMTFVLKNTGTEDLKILNAKPGCGCTVATFDKLIPPGQVGKVTAELKTENYRGPVEKTITVTSSDPTNENVTLRLKANVVGSAQILPRPGLALPSGSDWSYSGKLIIRKDETETGDLALTDVATNAPWLKATARKVDKLEPPALGLPVAQPGDYVLEIAVADDAPKTGGGFQVTFKTGLPREPVLTVPVSVVLEAGMRVTPSPLFLPEPAEGKGTQAVLRAAVRPGLTKEKLTAQASPEAFRVTVEPDGERKYKAIVTWNPADANTPTEGNVVFRIGDESQTVLLRVGNGTKATAKKSGPTAGDGGAAH